MVVGVVINAACVEGADDDMGNVNLEGPEVCVGNLNVEGLGVCVGNLNVERSDTDEGLTPPTVDLIKIIYMYNIKKSCGMYN